MDGLALHKRDGDEGLLSLPHELATPHNLSNQTINFVALFVCFE